MDPIIKVENLGKRYRLGVINRGMLYKDIQSWWARKRGKEDPHSPIRVAQTGGDTSGQEFWAFRNVDFEVKPGEILGVIGRNGAGKSTLLKVLSQITAPTEGHFKLKGRVASLLEVGTGFHGELTGRENIYLNGAILGMSRSEVRSCFDEIVEFAEIGQFVDTPVKRYSSGMYVRLAFSVVAHPLPNKLIVDEVLAVGDAAFQKKCLGRMDEAAFKEGRTILFVSHNMASVRSLCTRALLLSGGQLEADGPTGEIVDCYLDKGVLPPSTANQEDSDAARLKITAIHYQTVDGGRTVEVFIGQPIDIVIEYENKNVLPHEEISVGIGLHGPSADLFNNYSHFSGKLFSRIPDKGAFVFRWPSVDLLPGHYLLAVRVVVRKGLNDEEVLAKPSSISLIVAPADFHKEGSGDGLKFGLIAVRGEWKMLPGGKS